MGQSRDLAVQMGKALHQIEQERDGEMNYFLQKMFSSYYGEKVYDTFPHIVELHDKLVEIGADSHENSVWYGDADVYVWYEKAIDPERRIIVINNVVSCADKPMHIVMLNRYEPDEDVRLRLNELHVVAVHPYEDEETKRGDTWNDHRDWDRATLKTYRDHDFSFGYNDGRDDDHVLIYKDILRKEVESPLYDVGKLEFFFMEFSWAHEAITKHEDYTKR